MNIFKACYFMALATVSTHLGYANQPDMVAQWIAKMAMVKPHPPTQPFMATSNPLRILHFGDSHLAAPGGGQSLGNELAKLCRQGEDVCYLPIGKNGARMKHLTASTKRSGRFPMAAARRFQPDVVVVAFGTNEGMDPKATVESIAKDTVECMSALRVSFPRATFVFVGPPDGHVPHLHEALAGIKLGTATARVPLVDRMQAMGGPGSFDRWASYGGPTMMNRDGIHMKDAGYRRMNQIIAPMVYHAFLEARPAT